MAIRRSLSGLALSGLAAIGFGLGMGTAALAQVPGATIGLPADITDLRASPPSRDDASGTAVANPGGLSFGNGSRAPSTSGTAMGTGNAVDPGGLSPGGARGAGIAAGSTGNLANPRRAGTGIGGGASGAISRPTQTDDYLNPLYGRGTR